MKTAGGQTQTKDKNGKCKWVCCERDLCGKGQASQLTQKPFLALGTVGCLSRGPAFYFGSIEQAQLILDSAEGACNGRLLTKVPGGIPQDLQDQMSCARRFGTQVPQKLGEFLQLAEVDGFAARVCLVLRA